MNNDIDYSKSIIQFEFKKVSYFTLWGEDHECDMDDKFLTHNGKILLFSNEESLTSYILESKNHFFDKKNTKQWIKTAKTIDVIYHFEIEDLLQTISHFKDKALDPDILDQLVDVLNLIGDYAFQLDNKKLISIFKSEIVQGYLDHFYDHYFWKTQPDQRSNFNQVIELKQSLIEFKELLSTCFTIV